jgi:uncharacterized protein YdcH (DUF465 family)
MVVVPFLKALSKQDDVFVQLIQQGNRLDDHIVHTMNVYLNLEIAYIKLEIYKLWRII